MSNSSQSLSDTDLETLRALVFEHADLGNMEKGAAEALFERLLSAPEQFPAVSDDVLRRIVQGAISQTRAASEVGEELNRRLLAFYADKSEEKAFRLMREAGSPSGEIVERLYRTLVGFSQSLQAIAPREVLEGDTPEFEVRWGESKPVLSWRGSGSSRSARELLEYSAASYGEWPNPVVADVVGLILDGLRSAKAPLPLPRFQHLRRADAVDVYRLAPPELPLAALEADQDSAKDDVDVLPTVEDMAPWRGQDPAAAAASAEAQPKKKWSFGGLLSRPA